MRLTFTVNLPDGKSWEDYDLETFRARLNPTFLVMGREVVGRKHFQGYFELEKKILGSKIDKIFRSSFPLPMSVHYEVTRGSGQQNLEYCTKEDEEAFIFGQPSFNPGQRNDLVTLFEAVKEGTGPAELADLDPKRWAVHRKALEEYRMLVRPKRTWPSELVFIWGPTGTGKTCHAMELEPETVSYREPFLTGYTGSSDAVLFDDFNWRKMDPKFWLTLCDRYPMTVEVKGGYRNWAPRTIIFTSNDDPKDWWPESRPETRAAIHRRMEEFGKTTHLGELVPHTRSLKDMLLRKRPEPEPEAGPSTGPQPLSGAMKLTSGGDLTDDTQVIDLSLSDDEDEHSCPSDYELEQRRLKKARAGKMAAQ